MSLLFFWSAGTQAAGLQERGEFKQGIPGETLSVFVNQKERGAGKRDRRFLLKVKILDEKGPYNAGRMIRTSEENFFGKERSVEENAIISSKFAIQPPVYYRFAE